MENDMDHNMGYPTPAADFAASDDDNDKEEYEVETNEEVEEVEEGNRTLRELPDLTQQRISQIPEIQEMYQAYADGFSRPATSNESHLERAKTLAVAMLEHYYPK